MPIVSARAGDPSAEEIVECLRREECWLETVVLPSGRKVSYCVCDND